MPTWVRWVGAVIGLWAGPAVASGFLLPINTWDGQNAPLPARRLEAKITIRGQWARVTTTYVFTNPSSSEFEGLLKTKLRPGAAVLDFAYWFRGVRVPAKVYDKDQARRIYETIVRGLNRDPAILERKGDWYEGRIFPIEPNSDLRIELQYAYLLPFGNGTWTLDYPLTARYGAEPIEDLRIEVDEQGYGAPTRTLTCNFPDAVVRASPGSHQVTLHRRRAQPTNNFVLRGTVGRGPTRGWFASDSAPGQGPGYFLLLVWPDRPLRQPRVSLEGGRLSHLIPARLPAVRAGGRLALWGRCDGVGPATAVVRDGGYQWRLPVRLPEACPAECPPGVIARLWARRYIERLTGSDPDRPSPRYRATVIELSKRFVVDSPFTAFLAVPDSEWSNYVAAREALEREVRTAIQSEIDGYRQAKVLPRWLVPSDPLIKVRAPADARAVVARLPDGDLIPLRYVPAEAAWIGRFEIPRGTPEGEYTVLITVMTADGGRQELAVTYLVDLTPPQAAPRAVPATRSGGAVKVALAAPEAAKVVLVTPWSARLELRREADSGQFATSLTLPAELSPGSYPLRLLVFDRVHHLTEVETTLEVTP